ncbi:MAG: glycosyltransferase family 4 protein [Pseudomonadota bacterium]
MPFRAKASGCIGRPAFQPELTYAGKPLAGRFIQLYAVVHNRASLANVSRGIAEFLSVYSGPVGVQSITGLARQLPAGCRVGTDAAAPIGFCYATPDLVRPPALAHAVRILGFACEADRIPDRWVDTCADFDLIVVPSRYCERVLRASGVENAILVAHHGIGRAFRPRPRPLRGAGPFVFYSVVNTRMPDRKGLSPLLEAFAEEFSAEKVTLHLRGLDHDVLRAALASAGLDGDRRIRLLDADADEEDYAAHFARVDCTVQPSRAEGFGLVPLQSIASGTPVITPQGTGLAEYVTARNAIVLPVGPLDEPRDPFYTAGRQPTILVDDVRRCLRLAFENPGAERARALAASSGLRREFSWARVTRPLGKLLLQLGNLPDATDRAKLLEPLTRRR